MELQTNEGSIVDKMNNIQFTWNEMLKENSELQDKISIDEKELVQCKTAINRGEKELKKMQTLLEQLQQHVSEIPVMKQRQVELEDEQNNVDKLLIDKDIKISNMKAEHDQAMKDASNDFEKIKNEITSLYAQKIIEVENMLSIQHKEQQLDQRSLIYEAELNKMKNQLNSLRDATNQNKPGSSEIFRKKMQAMQQHYESQLRELQEKLQMALHDESIKTPIRKKNVTFNLSDRSSIANNNDENVEVSTKVPRHPSSSVLLPVCVDSISMKDKNKETNDRELTGGDDFKSLFLDAAINFGSENYSSSKDYKKSDKSYTNNCTKPIFKFAKKTTTYPQTSGYSELQNKVITSKVSNMEAYQTPSSIPDQKNPNSDQVSSPQTQHKRFILASSSKTKMTSPRCVYQQNLSCKNNEIGVYESYNQKRKYNS